MLSTDRQTHKPTPQTDKQTNQHYQKITFFVKEVMNVWMYSLRCVRLTPKLSLLLHHQGSTLIIAFCQAATNLVDRDWGLRFNHLRQEQIIQCNTWHFWSETAGKWTNTHWSAHFRLCHHAVWGSDIKISTCFWHDHRPQLNPYNLKVTKPKQTQKTKSVRKIKATDIGKFCSDLQSTSVITSPRQRFKWPSKWPAQISNI